MLVETTMLGYVQKTDKNQKNKTISKKESLPGTEVENKVGLGIGVMNYGFGGEIGASQIIRLGSEGSRDFKTFTKTNASVGGATVEKTKETRYGKTTEKTNFVLFKAEVKFIIGFEVKIGF